MTQAVGPSLNMINGYYSDILCICMLMLLGIFVSVCLKMLRIILTKFQESVRLTTETVA